MKIYESHAGMYNFTYLPLFAKFILDKNLDEFVRDQIRLSHEFNLPLLKHIKNYTEEQQFEIARRTSGEYLKHLAENRAKEQLETSFNRWITDQLSIIGKFDITAEDVTLFNYLRGKLFKKWLRVYPIPLEQQYALIDEIDTLLFGSTTSATNTFIEILKNKIQQESHLNEKLINTSPGIIFIFDVVSLKEIYINGNVQGVMGFTGEEVIQMGENFLPFLTHPDDLDHLFKHMQRSLLDTEGKTHQLEYRFKHKNGTYRWLRTYYTIFKRNENGKPLEVLGTTFEITGEKETALALAKREAQLLEAQSIALIGSYEWDLVNNVSVNTPQVLKIFEFENPRAHEEFMENVHPQDKAKVQQAIEQSLISGNYDCQYRYIVNGKEKFLWARSVVIFQDGKPVSMRGTIQDITQLKKIEDELVQKTKELERSNESLQQFASIASHDLKEPLRKMSMYSDMVLTLEQGKISENSHSNLGKVKASSIRMQNMIDDILAFSSITGKPRKQRVDLNAIVDQATEILEELIREKNAVIEYRDLPTALIIPPQIRQLFQNLIGNALKFSKKNTTPVIRITHSYSTEHDPDLPQRAERYLVIRVSDNGIGFKQDQAQKIFGLFTRLHSRSSYEGSGLGLSICKRVVENHGGRISAESEPDKGATFIITLPDNVA